MKKSQDSRQPYKDKKKKKNVNTDKSCQTNFTVFIHLYSRSKHSKKSIHFNFFSKKKNKLLIVGQHAWATHGEE